MNHKISIENLGPIKKIENFEIKGVNLVIGESASGKSVLAKAIFFFHSLFLGGYITFPYSKERADFRIFGLLEGLFPTYSGYKLKYCYSDDLIINIQKRKNGKFNIEISGAFENKISGIDEKVRIAHQEMTNISEKLNEELLEKVDNKNLGIEDEYIERELCSNLGLLSDVLFIPATRSFVSDFDDIRLSSMNAPESSEYSDEFKRLMMFSGDATLKHFSNIHRRFIRGFESSEAKHDKILKGRLFKNETTGTIQLSVDDQTLGIDQFSSGQKGLAPIIIILMGLIKQKCSAFIIIEEPEAHILSHDERRIFELIIEVANKTGSKVFITTHSSYILMSANNLISAEKRNYTKLKNKFIPFDNINAQKLVKGVNKPILKKNCRLIDANYIESIADDIMDDFDKILGRT